SLDAIWVCLPFVVGVSIPTFYDWTEADQSRPSAWVSAVIVGPLISALIVSFVLPWWPSKWSVFRERHRERETKFHFSIANLLAATTLLAVLAASYSVRPHGSSVVLVVLAYLAVGVLFLLRPANRWKIAQSLSCLLLPSIWCLWFGSFGDYVERIIPWLGFFPALLPAMVLGNFFEHHTPDHPLGILLTGLILSGCLLAIESGNPKLFRFALVWTLAIACSSSMILNALVRM
ncbi:MAG: hypothetical protein AAGG44_17530, partial [Planctomycetota bacterium]